MTEFSRSAATSQIVPTSDAERRNEVLARIDTVAKVGLPDPHEQTGVMTLGVVLAFRRVLEFHNITDRGRRMKYIRAMTKDFESKLRTLTLTDG
jgi:hypothetical protein